MNDAKMNWWGPLNLKKGQSSKMTLFPRHIHVHMCTTVLVVQLQRFYCVRVYTNKKPAHSMKCLGRECISRGFVRQCQIEIIHMT